MRRLPRTEQEMDAPNEVWALADDPIEEDQHGWSDDPGAEDWTFRT